MITKECENKKYCCFYASDFHLEMILLPYIKRNINKDKFMIFTEENLSESMKILLSRTNLSQNEKKDMLDLDWNKKKNNSFSEYDLNNSTIIINGSSEYISNINEKIREINPTKVSIIDCYNINDNKLELERIQGNYDDILNSKLGKNV